MANSRSPITQLCHSEVYTLTHKTSDCSVTPRTGRKVDVRGPGESRAQPQLIVNFLNLIILFVSSSSSRSNLNEYRVVAFHQVALLYVDIQHLTEVKLTDMLGLALYLLLRTETPCIDGTLLNTCSSNSFSPARR